MAEPWKCPTCGDEVQLIVDGRWMSEAELLALPHAPRKIERRLSHTLTCGSEDHRMQLASRTHR